MHFPILQDLLILLGFSVFVVFLLQRLRMPSILGFLITGVIIGPYGLSLIQAVNEVEIISEIGVILLLFVIGMELSLKQLSSMRKTVFFGGFLQVGLTISVTTLIYLLLGFDWTQAVFVGFLFSLSSTAIVLKILQDRNEISAPHGRNALGILIFQDIIVVPMMLITPILAGHSADVWGAIGDLLLKSFLIFIITYFGARYLVPRLMHLIALTQSKELFLLTTITVCFAVAFLTSEAGLSLALGAFLAGLIISESKYSYQATSSILPFRELFTSFFFISIGMLLDLKFFLEHAGVILLMVLVVFIVKGTLASIAAITLRYPKRTVLLTGIALFQVGEFAFILSKVGIANGLLTPEMNQYFLSVSILSMFLTPFVLMYSDKLLSYMMGSDQPGSQPSQHGEHEEFGQLEDHLLIIGYGINGRNVARAARYAKIPYAILDINPDTVIKEKENGEPIMYGDAVHDHMLHKVHINKARVVVIAISDPRATKIIISNIRQITQSVYLIVRSRYVKEINQLIALGADDVIPEEFETSIEIFSRVLTNFLVPLNELENLVDTIRADNYQMFRPHKSRKDNMPYIRPDLKIMCVRILADSGEYIGKTIAESEVRTRFGVNILAISRKGEMINSILPDEKLLLNDRVFVSGDQENIQKFYQAVT